MPADKGKIAKNAIALYFRMAIVLVVSLYTARVVLQQLGASDYGTFNVVGGVIMMLNFLVSTLSQGVQRFINYYKGINDINIINKILWSSIIIMLAIALVITILGETLGLWFLNTQLNIPSDRMNAANWVYQFSILSMLSILVFVPYHAMIVANEDFSFYAYVSIGSAFFNLFIAFLLLASAFDKLIFYAVLMFLLHLGQGLAYYIICKKKYHDIHVVKHKEKAIFKSLMTFSGWNVLGGATFTAGTTGVNIILNIFFGTIVNAARGIAVQISTKVDEFINNIQQAMNPQITQLYAKGEVKEMQALVYDNFRWNFSLYWLIALPMIFEIDYVLSVWLGNVPEYTGIFTVIIVLRSLLKCFERPINTINFAIGDMKPMNIFATCSVGCMIVLVIVFFKIGMPPYWAFLLDCLSILACTIYYMFCASRHKTFSFGNFTIKIFLPVVAVIIVSTTGTFLIRQVMGSNFIRFLVTCVVSTTLTGVSLFYILYTKKNRETIVAKAMRMIKKRN